MGTRYLYYILTGPSFAVWPLPLPAALTNKICPFQVEVSKTVRSFFLSTIRTQFEIGMNHLSNLNLIRNSINSAQMAFLPWEVSTATDTPKIIYLCCAGNEGKLVFSCSRLKTTSQKLLYVKQCLTVIINVLTKIPGHFLCEFKSCKGLN